MLELQTLVEEYSDDLQFVRINKIPIFLNRDTNEEPIVQDVAKLKGKTLMAINNSFLAIGLETCLKVVKLSELDEFLSSVGADENLKFDLGRDLQFTSEIIYVKAFSSQYYVGCLSGDIFEVTFENEEIKKELLMQLGEGDYKMSSDGCYFLKNEKLVLLESTLSVVEEEVLDFEYKHGLCLAILKKEELIVSHSGNNKHIKLIDLGIEDKAFYFVQILNQNFVQVFFTGVDEEDDKKPDYQDMASVIVDIGGGDLEVMESSFVASADAFVENTFQTYAVELKMFLKEFPNITVISSSRSTSAQLLTQFEDSSEQKIAVQSATDDQYNITLPMKEADDTTTRGLCVDFWSQTSELASTLLQTPISKDIPIILILNSELELYCYFFVHLSDFKAGNYDLEKSRAFQESRLIITNHASPSSEPNSVEETARADEASAEPQVPELNGSDEDAEEPQVPQLNDSDDEFEIISGTDNTTSEPEELLPEEPKKLGIITSMKNIVSKGESFKNSFSPLESSQKATNSSFSFGSFNDKGNPFAVKDGSPFGNFGSSSNKIESPFSSFANSSSSVPVGGLSFADKFKVKTVATNATDGKGVETKPIPETTFSQNNQDEQNHQNDASNLNTTYNTLDLTEDADDGSWVEVIETTQPQKLTQDNDSNSSIIEKDGSYYIQKKYNVLKPEDIVHKEIQVRPEIISAGSQTTKEAKAVEHTSVFADEKLFKPKLLNEAYPYPVIEKLYAVDTENVFNHKVESDDAGLIVFAKIINIVENELRALKANVKALDNFVTKQSEETYQKDDTEQLTDSSVHWRLGELNQYNKLLFDEFDVESLDLTTLKQKDEKIAKIISQSFTMKDRINKTLDHLASSTAKIDGFTKLSDSEEGLVESNHKNIAANTFKLYVIEECLKLMKIYVACGKELSDVTQTDLEQYLLEIKKTYIRNSEPTKNESTVKAFYAKASHLQRRKDGLLKRKMLMDIL